MRRATARRDRPGPPRERRGPHARLRAGPLAPRPPTCRRSAGGSSPSSASTSTAGSRWPRRSSSCSTASAARAASATAGRAGGRARARAGAASASWSELRERAGTRDRDLDLLALRDRGDRGARTRPRRDARRCRAERERLRELDGAAGRGGRRGGGDRARARGEAGRRRAARGGRSVWPSRSRAWTRSSTRWPRGCAALRIEAEDLGGGAAPLRRTRSRPSRAGSRRWRSGSSSTTGWSASTAASVAAVLAHAERCRAERDAARAGGGRDRAGAGGARRRRSRSATSWPRRLTATPGGRPRRGWRSACARSWRAWPWRARRSRSSSSRATRSGPRGRERVELMLAPNPGVPAAPLREAASGGELSRVMLALMTVAGAGESRTLVFDEVDAGVGGQTARAVGERLRALGGGPPGALHHPPAPDRRAGGRHFRIEKSAADGHRAHHGRGARGRRRGRGAVPDAGRRGLRRRRPPPRRGAAGGGMSASRRAAGPPSRLAIPRGLMPQSPPRHTLHLRHRRRRLGSRQGHRRRLSRPAAGRPRPVGHDPEVRPVHQRRPGHDEPVPARRGVRHRGRRRDRPRPGPLRALHRRQHHARLQRHRRARSTTR